MVCEACVVVPFRLMVWLAGLPFSALSVKTAVLVSVPALCGVKLMLRLQSCPSASEKLLEQSCGVPLPGTCSKFAPITSPGVRAVSGWLPTSWIWTDCGDVYKRQV